MPAAAPGDKSPQTSCFSNQQWLAETGVFSFRLRASLFGRFNIDSINIDINININNDIDVDDKTNHFLQP